MPFYLCVCVMKNHEEFINCRSVAATTNSESYNGAAAAESV